MTVYSFQAEVISRGARMLRTALGPAIAAWLEDPIVVEVMLNPDGRLWVDRLSTGLADTGQHLAGADPGHGHLFEAHVAVAVIHGDPHVASLGGRGHFAFAFEVFALAAS